MPGRRFTAAKRGWLAAFGLFFALSAAWAVATPLGAAPDEPTHMVRAVAVSYGQITGTGPTQLRSIGTDLWQRYQPVRVPQSVAALSPEVGCFAFRPGTTAACVRTLNDSAALVDSATYAGAYNPAYYLLVGWPLRLVPGMAGMYFARLVSAALCAALMAWAASIARGVGRLAFAGVAAAATPAALFLAGTVNPNAPEAASGLLVWAALGAIALDPDPEKLGRRVGALALGAGVLVTVRPTGLEWLALVLCVAVVLVPRRAVTGALKRMPVRISLGAFAVCAVAAELWNRFYGGLNEEALGRHAGYGVVRSISLSVRALPTYTQYLIGEAGWNDTPVPFGTVVAWLAVIGVLVFAALSLAARREAVVVLGLSAGIAAIPVAANLFARELANPWQGRYLLWWAAGLPVIAAMVLEKYADRLPARFLRRLPPLIVLTLAAGQLGMWWISARRYGVGLGAKHSLLPLHTAWHPPGGWIPSTLLLLLGLAVMLLLALPEPGGSRPALAWLARVATKTPRPRRNSDADLQPAS